MIRQDKAADGTLYRHTRHQLKHHNRLVGKKIAIKNCVTIDQRPGEKLNFYSPKEIFFLYLQYNFITMKRTILFLYQLIIWLPLFSAATLLTALVTTVGCALGGERIFSYYPGKFWSKIACWLTLCPVKVIGREKLLSNQSYIFVANHQGVYDIFLLYGYLDVPIKWIMKQSLRSLPFVGKACEMAGFIFVDNSSPVAAAKTIRMAEQRLKNGASIALFPEGSRTRTGEMGKFKKGAYQMAIDMKLPIVPVTITGSYQVMSRHTVLFNPHRMEVIIHEPIPTENLSVENTRDAAAHIRTLLEQSQNAIASKLC
jgi:1-acyl-sn-glycerol-3-phosphate acyltransferase